MSGSIPEYALQPARAPKIIAAKARYATERFICREHSHKSTFQVEEDILVPDIKPDMEEVLSAGEESSITPGEKKLASGEELVNLSGEITLQVVYRGTGNEIETLDSRLAYTHQWKSVIDREADAVFSCKVKRAEYTIINERKLRARITVELTVSFCKTAEILLLSGIEGDTIQIRKEPVAINCLSAICKDEIDITETFKRKDGLVPEKILRQDYSINESYRQITADKIVLNGFVLLTLLYIAQPENEEAAKVICQQTEKIEFTQFIPIAKNNRGREYAFSQIEFSGNGLHTEISAPLRGESDESISVQREFQCGGSIETKVYLYESSQMPVVTDAYHMEKNLIFEPQRFDLQSLYKISDVDINSRNVINLKEMPLAARKTEAGLFGYCTIQNTELNVENGKGELKGTLEWRICYSNRDGKTISLKEVTAFSQTFDWGDENGEIEYDLCIKNIKADFINDSQVEVNCQMRLNLAGYEQLELVELKNTSFEEGFYHKTYPMVIAYVKQGETLWDIAKRHHTTEEIIRKTNNLEETPSAGTRILIMK